MRLVILCAAVWCLLLVLVPAQEVGTSAPPLAFEHSLQGPAKEAITWKELRGKVVVLEFWATW